MPVRKTFAIFISILVLIVIGVGLFLSGSPAEQRKKRVDEQRAQHLQEITYAMDSFWNKNTRLPETLGELQRTPDVYLTSTVDPSTGIPYSYRIVEDKKYELCATFESETSCSVSPCPVKTAEPQFWSHKVGLTCFSLEARTFPR